jgi:acyl carrier protein
MTRTIVDREELRAALADILDLEVALITDAAQFTDDLGVDSLMALEVLVELERRYGVRIEESRLPDMTSLQSTYEVLIDKMAGH